MMDNTTRTSEIKTEHGLNDYQRGASRGEQSNRPPTPAPGSRLARGLIEALPDTGIAEVVACVSRFEFRGYSSRKFGRTDRHGECESCTLQKVPESVHQKAARGWGEGHEMIAQPDGLVCEESGCRTHEGGMRIYCASGNTGGESVALCRSHREHFREGSY